MAGDVLLDIRHLAVRIPVADGVLQIAQCRYHY